MTGWRTAASESRAVGGLCTILLGLAIDALLFRKRAFLGGFLFTSQFRVIDIQLHTGLDMGVAPLLSLFLDPSK